MSKAMTLRLPDAAHEMLRTKAFTERTSITALVLDAIAGAWGKPGTLCDERRCWNETNRIVGGGMHFCADHGPAAGVVGQEGESRG